MIKWKWLIIIIIVMVLGVQLVTAIQVSSNNYKFNSIISGGGVQETNSTNKKFLITTGDTINNISSSQKTFLIGWIYTLTLDIYAPNITIISPQDQASITTRDFEIKFNVTDLWNVTICQLNYGSVLTTKRELNQSLSEHIFNVFDNQNGQKSFVINCTDSIGNVGGG